MRRTASKRRLIDPGEAALGVAGFQELRPHHGRERERDDARDDHGAREREGELPEQRAGQAALDADRRVHGRERDRHRDDRPDELPRRLDRGVEGTFPEVQVPFDVLDHDDRVVHDEPDGEHDREERQEVDREAGDEHEKDGADERDRNRDDGDEDGAERPQEQEDDDDDDEERLGERLEDLVDRVLDVLRRVVGDPDLHARRELRPDARDRLAHALDHVERVRGREHPDAHERRALPVEADVRFVVLGAEDDVRDLAELHDRALVLLDDEVAEVLDGLQVRVRDEVHGDHGPLRAPDRGERVVVREGVPHLGGREAERGHPVGLEPDPHRERAAAEDVGPLDAADRGELRLDDARQVVRDLVLVQLRRGEPDVHRGELRVGGLEVDHGSL